MNKTTSGFTIVELLIVIVVIAILAVISIVAYNGIQNRLYNSAVQQDLRNIAQKFALYRAASESDQYPVTPVELRAAEISATRDAYGDHHVSGGQSYNLLYCPSAPIADDFALVARSKSGDFFLFKQGAGLSRYEGSWGGGSSTICPAVGVPSSTSTAGRTWFYDQSSWRSFIK